MSGCVCVCVCGRGEGSNERWANDNAIGRASCRAFGWAIGWLGGRGVDRSTWRPGDRASAHYQRASGRPTDPVTELPTLWHPGGKHLVLLNDRATERSDYTIVEYRPTTWSDHRSLEMSGDVVSGPLGQCAIGPSNVQPKFTPNHRANHVGLTTGVRGCKPVAHVPSQRPLVRGCGGNDGGVR